MDTSLINADCAPDIFAAELVRIDKLGCNRRLIFAVPSTEGGRWKMVQVKLIVPADYMVTLGALILGHGSATESSVLALMETGDTPN